MRGFVKGDPRAAAAGRKGGRMRRFKAKRSDEYVRGYRSGWLAGRREAREWIAAAQSRKSQWNQTEASQ